ncbi:hypothetical protein [Streptomyces yerevanensis]|uniref:hypothetical protein n=1 Tax=Streptomyces yerevanensis TaxID=66378 RepID=UPI0005255350|nr:hypothetical protein [Streptomyces yerevanensis]
MNSHQNESSHENGRQRPRRTSLWARAVRSPWTVACVVAAVVVGPSAATASALDHANAAPPHSAPWTGSYVPEALRHVPVQSQ